MKTNPIFDGIIEELKELFENIEDSDAYEADFELLVNRILLEYGAVFGGITYFQNKYDEMVEAVHKAGCWDKVSKELKEGEDDD